MDYRETLIIPVFDLSYDGWEGKLPNFIAEMQHHLDAVPEEYRASVNVTIELEEGYCDSSASLTFTAHYERPETDEEMVKRKNRDAAERAAFFARAEAEERATFEALKAKYEPKP